LNDAVQRERLGVYVMFLKNKSKDKVIKNINKNELIKKR